jgi:hypothetical protein
LTILQALTLGVHDATLGAVNANHGNASLVTKLADSRLKALLKPAVEALLVSNDSGVVGPA